MRVHFLSVIGEASERWLMNSEDGGRSGERGGETRIADKGGQQEGTPQTPDIDKPSREE